MNATIDDRIAGLFLAGHGIDFITEQGLYQGWTRQRARQVAADRGWTLERSGKLTADHMPEHRPSPAKPEPEPRPRPQRPRPEPPAGYAPRLPLSPRQRQVVEELSNDGPTNEQIAARLGCSVESVKTHIRVALKAAGMTNRTELALAVARNRVRLETAGHGTSPR